MSNFWIELVRALMVGLGGVILGIAAYVVAIYNAKIRAGEKGLLPRHIRNISISYCLLIIATAGTQLELLVENDRVTWRLPIIILAYVMGISALRLILIYVQRRNHR